MATYDLTMSDIRIVFNPNFDCISFYKISLGEITNGECLLNSSPRYIRLKLVGSTLQVENGLSQPGTGTYSSYDEYGPDSPLSDIWNSSTELVVGTGDLLPSGSAVDPAKFSMANKGIVITSPSEGCVGIYTLS